MDIVKVDDFALIKTKKEFVLIFKEKIYGPFPSTNEMYAAFCYLLDNPFSSDAIKKFESAKRKG